jgi:hypothetical protein
MKYNMLGKLVLLCFFVSSAVLVRAQITPGMGSSTGVQFYTQSWTVKDGTKSQTIHQSVLPIGVYVPIRDGIEMRVATAFVNFGRNNATTGQTEQVSGLSDLKLQGSIALLTNRNLVLNLAGNLPIGKKALTRLEQDIVTEFVAPDLSVRENRLGEGFNAGGTLSYVKDISATNLIGVSGGFVYHGAFDTIVLSANQSINLRPGYEVSGLFVYGSIGDEGSFQFSPSFTLYGSEQINSIEALQLGTKGQIQGVGTKFFNGKKGMFTFMLSDTFRQPTKVLQSTQTLSTQSGTTQQLTAQNIISPNYFVLLFSIDHAIGNKLRATFTNVGRIIGPKGSSYGNSSVYEGGLTLSANLSPKVGISIGQRFITGSGVSWLGTNRNIQGFEVFARSSIRF